MFGDNLKVRMLIVTNSGPDAMEATLPQSDIPFVFGDYWTINTAVLDSTPPTL